MSPTGARVVLILLAFSIAIIAGLLGGILMRACGDPLPKAIWRGGGAAGATLVVVIAVMTALQLL